MGPGRLSGRRPARRARRWAGPLLALLACAQGCSAPVPHGGGPAQGPARTVEECSRVLPCGVTAKRVTRHLEDGRAVRISVVSVAPSAGVEVRVVHGAHVATAGTVEQLAHLAGAVAAVNGAFFATVELPGYPGYPGDVLGVEVADGRLVSEAADGATALILPGPGGGRPRVDEVATRLTLRADDGARRELDGVNRVPGRILGCGGTGGDLLAATRKPESRPRHNQLCVDDSEIVAFGPEWGVSSPPGADGSAEVLLDGRGRVTDVRRPAGGRIPRGGSTLAGIGEGADWLLAHARRGRRVARDVQVTGREGGSVLAGHTDVIGAGPALVRDGKQWINSAANGFAPGARDEREPRTVAAVKKDGTLLLAVFDGRTASSAGVSLVEAAEEVLRMGAVEAVNLDGGGSSTAVVGGELLNEPSDGEQRPVADALAVVPR
ncbi:MULTISPECIES: phosphodiester glycosidase family protein [unclassified Streptomyces]|uniref:phosphodiester glycosidase family protein n=1 Tax=unclassified Streptomyces TaxID=2593676 RepID=UPI00369155D6